MALTQKQELFCHQIAKGLPPSEAARGAGFAPSSAKVTACRMMAMPKIIERVAKLKALVENTTANKVAVDKAWVIAQLVENVEMAKPQKDGKPDGKADLASANRALELIGKEMGMFVDRKEVRTGNLDLSDEELDAALIAARALVAAENPRAREGVPARDQSPEAVSPLRATS